MVQEIVRQEIFKLVVKTDLIQEKYKIYQSPEKFSSFWRYDDEIHYIVLNPEEIRRESQKDTAIVAKDHLYHELGHSFFTGRDAKKRTEELNRLKISFFLWNMFEDARIEHRMMSDGIYKFNTLTDHSERALDARFNEYVKRGKESAVDLFFWFYRHHLIPKETILDHVKFFDKNNITSRVYRYYDDIKTLAYDDDEQKVFKLVAEFVDEFHIRQNLYETMQLPEEMNDKKFKELIDNAIEISLSSVPKQKLSKVDELVNILRKVFQVKTINDSNDIPSSRIDINNYVNEKWSEIYQNREIKGSDRIPIHIVVDCSGSMEGNPIEDGILLLQVMSRLTAMGVIKCEYSTTNSIKKLQTYALPMNDTDIVKSINVGGHENFANNLPKLTKKMARCAKTFLYTDGCVMGGRIDKKTMHSLGVYTIGMYVGNVKDTSLRDWIDKPLITEDIKSLILGITKEIRSCLH